MRAILKTAAGIYILSVLAFSSWSKASADFEFFSEVSFKAVLSVGVVFEEDGFLYFQEKNGGEFYLIHSNSIDLFYDLNFPIDVEITGASMLKKSGFDSLNSVLQVSEIKVLDN